MKQSHTKKLNIIIADDHPIFRSGLKSVLEKVDLVNHVYEAENGIETLELLMQLQVHLVFTDIEMPLMDGIECTKIIRLKYPEIKIVALTMFDSVKYILELYDSGVYGYLLKNTDLAELTKAIETIYHGEHFYTKQISDVLYNGLLNRETISEKNSEIDLITDREIDILKMICEQLTSLEIAEKLFISPKTVERHKENIYSKTETKNLAGLAVFAIKHGLYQIKK